LVNGEIGCWQSGDTGTDAAYIYVIFDDVKVADWAGAGKLLGTAR